MTTYADRTVAYLGLDIEKAISDAQRFATVTTEHAPLFRGMAQERRRKLEAKYRALTGHDYKEMAR